MALALCALLVLSSTLPAVAFASEGDSEGEGTASPIEAPDAPDFDPGGEESTLEETPASVGGEEGGAVEVEPEVDVEVPAPEASAVVEEPQPQAIGVSVVPPAPESTQQTAAAEAPPAASEPVANQSLAAPKQKPREQHVARERSDSGVAAPPAEPSQEEKPSSPAPQPVAGTAVDSSRDLAGKSVYVVRPGDCLWHIAAALLPSGASTAEIEDEIGRLWRLNEDRIGTGDPSLIYVGTTLRLR